MTTTHLTPIPEVAAYPTPGGPHDEESYRIQRGDHILGYAFRGIRCTRWTLDAARGMTLIADADSLISAIAILTDHDAWLNRVTK